MTRNILAELPADTFENLVFGGTLDQGSLTLLTQNFWFIIGGIIIGLIIFTIFTCLLSYGYYLNIRVYQSYIAGEKLAFRKNNYWDRFRILKFTGILGWASIYMLPPFLILLGLLLGLFALVQFGVLTPNTNELHSQILAGL